MPGYKSNIFAGAALAGALIGGSMYMGWFDAEPLYIAILISVAVLGSLFPDCGGESKAPFAFYAILAILDIALILNGYYRWSCVVGLFAMLPVLVKVKGWADTWWAMLLVPAPILALPWIFFRTSWDDTLPFFLAAVAGYLAHLVLKKVA